MYNNDDRWQGRPPIPNYEKINNRSFWQRHRWIIISSVSILLVLFFASTTLYLLLNRAPSPAPSVAATRSTQAATIPTTAPAAQAQAPTPTSETSLSATPVSSTPQPTTTLSATSTNYQFICLADCSNKVGVNLTSINVDATAQTMIWNFNITNNGTCSSINGNISLEASTGGTIDANGGTFRESIDFNAGQMLPRSATFSTIPKRNTPYTVKVAIYCSFSSNDYQAVLFSY